MENNKVRWWMEFVTPTTAKVVARYKHPSWPGYAAVTRNNYGRGEKPQKMSYGYASGTDLLSGRPVTHGQPLELKPWGVAIVEAR